MHQKIINQASSFIKNEINKWNNFSMFPLKGELWEERLANAFANAGIPNNWEPDGNHKPGIDFSLNAESFSYSCKSAVLKKGILTISSYRTTKYKTLSEKIDYHDSPAAKPFTHYAVLVRDIDNKQQVCIFIDKDYISAQSLSWQETIGTKGKNKGKVNGWTGTSDAVSMKIQKQMSDQFWYYINWDHMINSGACIVACKIGGPNVRL
jgi:hypothetical protein